MSRVGGPYLPKLYKYTTPEHAERMVGEGSVRVGTLHDFRRIESVGAERGDPREGMRVIQADGPVVYTSKTLPAHLKFLFPKGKMQPGVTIQMPEGARITTEEKYVDMYVYCLSSRLDDGLKAKFGGACVRVNDPASFFRHIVQHIPFYDPNGIRENVQFIVGPVEYKDRVETYPQVTHYDPVFRKPPSYASEHEYRARWAVLSQAPGTSLTPQNLVIPELANCCERIG